MKLKLLILALFAGIVVVGCSSGESSGTEPAPKGEKPAVEQGDGSMKSPEERGRAGGGGTEGS